MKPKEVALGGAGFFGVIVLEVSWEGRTKERMKVGGYRVSVSHRLPRTRLSLRFLPEKPPKGFKQQKLLNLCFNGLGRLGQCFLVLECFYGPIKLIDGIFASISFLMELSEVFFLLTLVSSVFVWFSHVAF